MGDKALRYSFYAIVTYLGVAYATGAGKLISSAGNAGGGLVKAFQGR